ncbi:MULTISPECIES: hypothetical protein [unclassified Paenibacillus]|uniref:hypothetical protein n=1 Tax=unclassified Paenibacillus TaxID=185978 RepID=UPI001AE10C21|nr:MULTISPECIES: hypothetical protein [unclassified Paenibacillus]MBP1157333.1 putative lipoprotein [Paenibacillus sp. PvP091]MBP1171928.1 putative lipoprotein [Paenibacillus sp. PvR098]MBP2438309.1 putative lipoprotein [Paenibacillus sp. PvP052]
MDVKKIIVAILIILTLSACSNQSPQQWNVDSAIKALNSNGLQAERLPSTLVAIEKETFNSLTPSATLKTKEQRYINVYIYASNEQATQALNEMLVKRKDDGTQGHISKNALFVHFDGGFSQSEKKAIEKL